MQQDCASIADLRASTRWIEDYALVGDCETATLVGCDGSIDWLCWPRFDCGACFASLLGLGGAACPFLQACGIMPSRLTFLVSGVARIAMIAAAA